ncbi:MULTISPECIES: serine protease [Nostoc]|uniref:Tetratricopeptide repeat protein n=1 Tax=Nostoc paludosum FACHB-159 TaxID=2692908 RepID=A0ABR8K1D1_9NOSO|nr:MULTISPECIES: serine protease [Nostoc]MBD2677310.1 tetratricopeptide repeat protein [Nostoc sp. FACHB-857]MBD2732880.1 tetratricopeptide repeat protein [Nostoc paludosum FACHB-159]
MNKLNSLIIAILSTYLVLPNVYAATFHKVANQSTSLLVNNSLSPEKIRQIAQAITVKVLSSNKGGSGVLISKQGKTYTILTNAHVISSKRTHSIQTFDGKTHTATIISRGNSLTGNDLALLQFESQENYQIVSLASTSNLSENQEVLAAGFPDDSKELVITNGKISLLSEQPLIGGYQIGYTNEIRQGMSGGALLNQEGKLIGINGLTNNAILNEAYSYQDGTRPSAEQIQKFKQFSFAVPIQTLAKVAPNLAIIPPEWHNQQQAQKPSVGNTFVDKVNNIAGQITVRIDSKNHGNGSGVIIAKQGQTYYVATARHVVENPDNYEIVTPDGKQYAIKPENIFKPKELDAAIVKFTSNQTYSIATISTYNLSFSDAFTEIKRPWVFVSGFPKTDRGNRKLTPGFLSIGEALVARSESSELSQAFLNRGYRLVYSNLSLPGMSGGPVLDVMGQVIGINTGIENPEISDIQIGFGYGVPSGSFLSLATQAELKKESLKISGTKAPSINDSEIDLLQNHPLFAIRKPSANANELDWLKYANQVWRIRKFSEAITILQETIKRNPNFYQAYYALGLVLGDGGKDPEKALVAFDKAIMLKPDYYEAWKFKSFALIELKKYSLALAAIDKAIEYNDSDLGLYLQRTSILFNLQRYPEALTTIDKAIEIQPFYFSYLLRGSLRFVSQDYQGALSDANQVIKLQPDFAFAYGIRGASRAFLKDTQGGLADMNQAFKLEPNNPQLYLVRGSLRYELKDYQEALSDYNQAIKLQPNNGQAYLSRSQVRFNLKDFDGGLADFRLGVRFLIKDNQGKLPDNLNAIIKQANNGGSYFLRGIVRSELKDFSGAISDYNQAMKLGLNDVIVYLNRGDIYVQLKDYPAALADYNQVIKLQPDNADGYFYRGVVYQKQGNDNAALSDYNQAFAKDEKFVPAIINIGYIKYEKGDVEGAIQQWQKAVEINGKLAEPQMALAVALYAKGERQKALNMAQAALGLDKSFADVEVLQENLWGTRLVDEARKLLTTPSIQAFIKQ